ncbi:nascent polypeptide-associated complex subunit alpha [Gracilaria domingensis]|nr:nascent polypeptide-associated complex subunit alpha [Gracilaria domingensis]
MVAGAATWRPTSTCEKKTALSCAHARSTAAGQMKTGESGRRRNALQRARRGGASGGVTIRTRALRLCEHPRRRGSAAARIRCARPGGQGERRAGVEARRKRAPCCSGARAADRGSQAWNGAAGGAENVPYSAPSGGRGRATSGAQLTAAARVASRALGAARARARDVIMPRIALKRNAHSRYCKARARAAARGAFCAQISSAAGAPLPPQPQADAPRAPLIVRAVRPAAARPSSRRARAVVVMLPRRRSPMRTRTDLQRPPTPTRRRGRSVFTSRSSPSSRDVSAAPLRAAPPTTRPPAHGTRFFNERTEVEWVLRGACSDRRLVHLALQRAARAVREERMQMRQRTPPVCVPPRPVGSEVDALLQPRRKGPRAPSAPLDTRHRDAPLLDSRRNVFGARTAKYRRALRYEHESDGVAYARRVNSACVEPGKFEWYDTRTDYEWRLPRANAQRRVDFLSDFGERHFERERSLWSASSASEHDTRWWRNADREDRRSPSSFRDDASVARLRDRTGKRIGGSSTRWRDILAKKELADSNAEPSYCESLDKSHDISPRSSLDIEEATSFYSSDEPHSTSIREWRSNTSLSYRPQPYTRPRHIKKIGRQMCLYDLSSIVDASNEPCVSYDRQIFDPVSKLWTYVEACQPSSSPWELRAVGSPVTWSASGTEEGTSSGSRQAAPVSADSNCTNAAPSPPIPDRKPTQESTQRRNSSPGFAAITSAMEAKRAFNATRDLWLGTTRKSVYGPANLEALIFASEIDDVEQGILRRASVT